MMGLLGGTFDPIHFGHLRLALEVQEQVGLQELRFIPCHIPAHRGAPLASPRQRLDMVERAIAGMPGWRADARELARPGPSYTVDTLTELREEVGEKRPLAWILGSDSLASLSTWHRWQELPRLAHFILVERPGQESVVVPSHFQVTEVADALLQLPAGLLLRFRGATALQIAASDLREHLRQGRSPRFLTPDTVCDYLQKHFLYAKGTAASAPSAPSAPSVSSAPFAYSATPASSAPFESSATSPSSISTSSTAACAFNSTSLPRSHDVQ